MILHPENFPLCVLVLALLLIAWGVSELHRKGYIK